MGFCTRPSERKKPRQLRSSLLPQDGETFASQLLTAGVRKLHKISTPLLPRPAALALVFPEEPEFAQDVIGSHVDVGLPSDDVLH